MIRKPTAQVRQESAVVANLRTVATNLQTATTSGVAVARTGSYYVRALVCWSFAILWGFAALIAGVFMQFPTFFGVGTLAIVAGWLGTRMFAKARGGRSPRSSREASRHDVEQPWARRVLETLPPVPPGLPGPTIASDGRSSPPAEDGPKRGAILAPQAVLTPRVVVVLIAGVIAVLGPLIYAGPQLASDLRVGGDWTMAPDLAVKESKCTRWYFLVTTCGVTYVNRLDPARPGDTLDYLGLGSWAGERAVLLRSVKEPNRIGSTLGIDHMRQRLFTFGVFVALALAYLVGVIRFLGRTGRPKEPVFPGAFGRRTTGFAGPV